MEETRQGQDVVPLEAMVEVEAMGRPANLYPNVPWRTLVLVLGRLGVCAAGCMACLDSFLHSCQVAAKPCYICCPACAVPHLSVSVWTSRSQHTCRYCAA